jgi:hypothetical protein
MEEVSSYVIDYAPLIPFNSIVISFKFDLTLSQWSTSVFRSLLMWKILKKFKPSIRERVLEIMLLKTLLSLWAFLMITQTTIIESRKTTIWVTPHSLAMQTPFHKAYTLVTLLDTFPNPQANVPIIFPSGSRRLPPALATPTHYTFY